VRDCVMVCSLSVCVRSRSTYQNRGDSDDAVDCSIGFACVLCCTQRYEWIPLTRGPIRGLQTAGDGP